MRKLAIASVLVLAWSGTTWAAQAAPAQTEVLKGTIIDNLCAGGNRTQLGTFVAAHTKDCALMPGCQASGYSLYTPEGKLLAFDAKSNARIVKFLKESKSKLTVTVKAKKAGDKLDLVSIQNQG